MRPKPPHVSLIILNWNGINDTLSLLDNLRSVRYDNFSVLVVDNGSTDNSASQLRHYIDKNRPDYQLSFLYLTTNTGFADGNNKGIVQAAKDQPDYYLLLNNDTLVDENFLTELVSVAEADLNIAAVGPTIFYASSDGQKQDKVWFAGGWFNFASGGAHHHRPPLEQLPDQSEQTAFLTGCCLLIRRTALEAIKLLFDPAFFAYCEDADLSLRLTKAGYQLRYAPKARIWHKLATSSGGPKSANFWYYNVRNNFLMLRRYGRWDERLLFSFYFLFHKPVLVSIVGAIIRPRADKWPRLVAIYAGTRDAFTGHFGKRQNNITTTKERG